MSKSNIPHLADGQGGISSTCPTFNLGPQNPHLSPFTRATSRAYSSRSGGTSSPDHRPGQWRRQIWYNPSPNPTVIQDSVGVGIRVGAGVEVGRSVPVGGDDKASMGAGAVKVGVAVGSTVDSGVAIAGGASWRSNKPCANHPTPHATPPRTTITVMSIRTFVDLNFNIIQFPPDCLRVLFGLFAESNSFFALLCFL